MKTYIQFTMLAAMLVLTSTIGIADTFTHKESGQSFDGFMTQKTLGGKTRVYNTSSKEMLSVDLSEYNVTANSKGRKDVVVVVQINQSETLLSEVIAREIAKNIIDASNRGAQAIIVHLDSPGGRGDFMQIITSAIEKTTNCPVIAYISADAYGGAFSAAAVIAMACDKVFIAPAATIGTIGPMTDTGATQEDFSAYLSTYCSDTLMLQRVDAEAQRLAEKHKRPGLIARALIDKRISVVEVTNVDGGISFIEKEDRQPTQTIVRTLSEGATPSEETGIVMPVDVVSLTLNLSAKEAVAVKLADATAGGYYDILTALEIPDAKISTASTIQKTLKKYQAARRNIAETLSRVSLLEKEATKLEEQVAYIDKQLRTGTQTREVRRGADNVYRRSSRTNLPDDYYGYYYDPVINVTTTTGGVSTRSSSRGTHRRHRPEATETITTTEPTTRLVDAQQDLADVLEDLVVEYRRIVTLSRRWPGALPPEVRTTVLQKNIASIQSTLDYLYEEIDQNLLDEEMEIDEDFDDLRSPRSRRNRRY